MPEPLEEQLGFDIAPALAAIGTLDDALAQVTASFSVNLADAFQSALATSVTVGENVDVAPLTSAIDGALSAATEPIPLEGDTTGLAADIAAVGAEPVPVELDLSDADAVIASLQAQLDAAAQVQLNAVLDTNNAADAIAALEATPVDLTAELDTTDAQAAADDLSSSTKGAAGGVSALEGAVGGFEIAAAGAEGSASGLLGTIEGIGPAASAGVAAAAVFTGFLGKTVTLAADAQAQEARLNQVFGESAEAVSKINVGGLVTSLEDLGKASGTPLADLQASASKIGLLGTTSGEAQPKVAGVTQQVLGLGATLAVQNPRLGNAADVSDRLFTALQRGGRAASNLGLNIPAKDIANLAQQLAGAGNEVSQFDKLQAGLQIALKGTGDTLGTQFANGANNAQVQLRALKVQLEETLVAIGKPLLGPAVESFTAILPVAENLGRVLGALGTDILPAIAAAGIALRPVAAIFGALADGLTVLGPLAPVVALGIGLITVGLDGLAIGLFDATVAVEAFTTSLATNPIFLAATAIAAIGFAFNAFGGEADGAKEATKNFSEALFPAGTAAGDLASQVAKLSDNINEVVTKFVDGVKPGSDFRAALDGVGGGVKGVSAALTGSQADFDKYTAAVGDSITAANQHNQATFETASAVAQAKTALDDQRKGLIAANEAQLAAIVSSNGLKQADLDAIEAKHRFADGTLDTVAALKEATLAADSAAEAQQKQTLATSTSTGALRDAIAAFNPAKDTVTEYTASLQQLGLTQADATKLAGDQVAAYTALHDKQLLASGSAQALEAEFATGAIKAGDLEGGLVSLGATVGAAAGEVTQLQSAIDGFAKSAVSALPSAASAVDAFGAAIKTATSSLESASKTGSSAVDSATKAVGAAEANLARARTSGDAAAAKAAQNAQDALDKAKRRLAELEAGSTASAAAVATAQNRVTDAQDKLNKVVAGSGTAGASALRSAQDRLTSAQGQLSSALGGSSAQVRAAYDALVKANDPQRLIDQFVADQKAIADFQKNLATLVSEGFGALAGTLASKGPEAGGALAAAFVSQPAKAKVAEGAEEGLSATTEGFQNFVTKNAGALGAVGADVAATINRGFAATFAIDHPTQAQLDAAEALVASAEPGLSAVGKAAAEATVVGFQGAFGRLPTVAELTSGEAAAKVTAAQTAGKNAGLTFGGATAAGFGTGVAGLKGEADLGIAGAKDAFTPQGHLDLIAASRTLGVEVGRFFDLGLIAGIADAELQQSIFDAAAAAAQKASDGAKAQHKSSSPSEVARQIGLDWGDGLVLGISASASAVEQAGKDAAAALEVPLPKIKLTTDTAPLTAALRAFTPPAIPVHLDAAHANVDLARLRPLTLPAASLAPAVTRAAAPAARAVDPDALARALVSAQAAAPAPVHAGAKVNATISLHKVDIDPLHLATELGWRLG